MTQKTETPEPNSIANLADLSELKRWISEELEREILWFETAKKTGVVPLRLLVTVVASNALAPLKSTLGNTKGSALINVQNEHYEVFMMLVRKAQLAIREGKLKVRHRVGLMDISDTTDVVNWCNSDLAEAVTIEEIFGPCQRMVVKVEDAKFWISSMGTPLPDWFREFDSPLGSALESESKWPWGDHNTKLLSDLSAAAHRWWKNYDPNDLTTTHTNKDVSEWLVKERGVAQRTAEAMATILRADGLPLGRRKE